jgi:hypothetical protein
MEIAIRELPNANALAQDIALMRKPQVYGKSCCFSSGIKSAVSCKFWVMNSPKIILETLASMKKQARFSMEFNCDPFCGRPVMDPHQKYQY